MVQRLEVYRDQVLVKSLDLHDEGIFIGRKETNDLVLDDRSVSKLHAEVQRKGQQWYIRDLDSTNGILVGGVRTKIAPLTLGKVYTLGSFQLHLKEVEESSEDVDATLPADTPKGVDKDAYQDLLALFRLNTRFASVMNTEELLNTMMDRLLEIFSADRGFILRGTDPDAGLDTAIRRDMSFEGKDAKTSRTFIRKALDSREPILATDQSAFPETVDESVRSVLCAPLLEEDSDADPFGVVYLDCRIGARLFTDRDKQLLETFCRHVSGAFRAAEERERLEKQVSSGRELARQESLKEHEFRDIIGSSRAIKEILLQVEAVAPQDVTVLVTGESGTGKELFAKAIHYNSHRRQGPFVAINCMALSPEIIESELFGHEKGAFSGAVNRRIGKLEMADGGTVFLDEIGELSHEVQVKLLRVLQEREIQRVGGNEVIPLDVRLVTATNVDLREATRRGTFREDLYYRLNVFSIHLPPLRERKEDLPSLVDFFIDLFNDKMGKSVDGTSTEAMRAMTNYEWPGNIRELRNIVERAMVLTTGDRISLTALPFDVREKGVGSPFPSAQPGLGNSPGQQAGGFAPPENSFQTSSGMHEARERLEQQMIEEALAQSKGNISAAARQLGVQRKTLHRKIESFHIELENFGKKKVELDREGILQALKNTNGSISAAARDLGVPRTTLYRNLDLFDITQDEIKALRNL